MRHRRNVLHVLPSSAKEEPSRAPRPPPSPWRHLLHVTPRSIVAVSCRVVSWPCRGRVAAVSFRVASSAPLPLPPLPPSPRPRRTSPHFLSRAIFPFRPTPGHPSSPDRTANALTSSRILEPCQGPLGRCASQRPPPHVSPGDCSGNGDPRRLQFPGSSSKGVSQLVCRGGGGRGRGRAGRAGRARVPPAGAGAPPPAGSPGSRTGAASRACARGRGDAGGGRGRAVG